MWKGWLLIRRTKKKPFAIPHHCTERQSLKSLISRPLCWAVNEHAGLVWRKGLTMTTSEASIKSPLPGWICMCWWLRAARPLITDKTLHYYQQRAADLNSLLDVNSAFKLWAFTQIYSERLSGVKSRRQPLLQLSESFNNLCFNALILKLDFMNFWLQMSRKHV